VHLDGNTPFVTYVIAKLFYVLLLEEEGWLWSWGSLYTHALM
jgi:hypothetical protein